MLLNFPHEITYWAPGGEDRYGAKTYSTPIIIKGRWEDKIENVIDMRGQDAVSRAKVYTESPVEGTGYIFPGVVDAADPTEVDGAWEIRIVGSSPNLSNLQRLYTAWV